MTCGDEGAVLYDQGWVHIGYWAGDTASDVVDEVVGYRDSSVTQETFPLLLDRLGDRFHGRYGAKHGD